MALQLQQSHQHKLQTCELGCCACASVYGSAWSSGCAWVWVSKKKCSGRWSFGAWAYKNSSDIPGCFGYCTKKCGWFHPYPIWRNLQSSIQCPLHMWATKIHPWHLILQKMGFHCWCTELEPYWYMREDLSQLHCFRCLFVSRFIHWLYNVHGNF